MKEIKITIKILQIIIILILIFSLYFKGIFNDNYIKDILIYCFGILISLFSLKYEKILFFIIEMILFIFLFKLEINEKNFDLNSDDKETFDILLNIFMFFTAKDVNDSNDSGKYLLRELKYFIFYFFGFFNSLCSLVFNLLNYYIDKKLINKKISKIKKD